MRIVVSGASGLIGTALVPQLRAQGHTVVRLVRRPPTQADELAWDPRTGEFDPAVFAGVDAVINLSGAGVGDHRWTTSYRQEILDSRVDATRSIATAISALDHKPLVLINASAIGWYGETGQTAVDERDRGGDDFLADVCRAWEGATDPARAAGIRTVFLRTGLVMDGHGGALARMIPRLKAGVGGRLGHGPQWWAGLTLRDEIRAILHLLGSEIDGPVNLVSPNPVTNAEFTAALARALRRPALLPVPGFALKIVLGGFSTEVLGSKRILPGVLADSGFTFSDPHILPALEGLVRES
jgi:uncharacterized protein (TIGR01777 family)